MDIDSPPSPLGDTTHPGHNHLELPEFSLSFPLPFRVLFLIGFAIFLWATNLHILHLLGLDTSWILDFRDPDLPTPTPPLRGGAGQGQGDTAEAYELTGTGENNVDLGGGVERPNSGKLYGPVYKLFVLYCAWVGGGWLLFRWISGGEEEGMERWRGLVGVIMLGAVVGAVLPFRGVGERERRGLRKCLKRILLPSISDPIFFADVILADILTSFAKVLGDMWVSSSQIWYGGITHGRVRQYGWSNWVTLSMVCLPYMLRLRQCLFEFHQSRYTSLRPLMNAAKYFSAFPVIILSAMQKTLNDELAQGNPNAGVTGGSRWHGEYQLFRVWLLAVAINSIFSFYWDVEMDWGLRLCEMETWFPAPRPDGLGLGLLSPGTPPRSRREAGSGSGLLSSVRRLLARDGPGSGDHHRSPHPTPLSHSHPHMLDSPLNLSTPHGHHSHHHLPLTAFGLRSTLLLPDPLVYHLFTLIDLVLRFTWSLKLSSHLHTISEIESGVFMMEALELVRRWMWVFVRIEWEAVKMGESKLLLGGNRGDVGRIGAGSAAAASTGLGLGSLRRGSESPVEVVWDEKGRR